MNQQTLLQTIDALHAMKDIPREVIFRALEESMAAAVRKRFGAEEDLICTIDRESGEVTIEDDDLDRQEQADDEDRPARDERDPRLPRLLSRLRAEKGQLVRKR